jgi:hypothetical protein
MYIPRPSKIYSGLDFWFENKPSGNPDENAEREWNESLSFNDFKAKA